MDSHPIYFFFHSLSYLSAAQWSHDTTPPRRGDHSPLTGSYAAKDEGDVIVVAGISDATTA
jgi:hypothetical protein